MEWKIALEHKVKFDDIDKFIKVETTDRDTDPGLHKAIVSQNSPSMKARAENVLKILSENHFCRTRETPLGKNQEEATSEVCGFAVFSTVGIKYALSPIFFYHIDVKCTVDFHKKNSFVL
ncbi:Hypothetical predicted protein [Octopus vulgaris]|uniref:Uncharacterized protein n=1 Tax=Octopus vulgaris TaxID=6645 RepID=A0AA36F9V5_OCTVU|nr:Hypothetical predicted protein [Octopus vulgaris]